MGQTDNTVTISIPRDAGFTAVAGLVTGGVAARHDVTLDVLDDVQLALGAILDHHDDDEGEVSVELRIEDGAFEAAVGPLSESAVAELEREGGEALGLRRLLQATVDDVSLTSRDGGAWVELRKSWALAGADA